MPGRPTRRSSSSAWPAATCPSERCRRAQASGSGVLELDRPQVGLALRHAEEHPSGNQVSASGRPAGGRVGLDHSQNITWIDVTIEAKGGNGGKGGGKR
jgi:hypothetical protein